MKKYDKYKKIEEAVWYDRIPFNWTSTKMRDIFSERRQKVSDKEYPPLSVGKMGVVPQLDTAVKTDNGENRKLIKKGDFAINSRSDRKGSGGMSNYDGSASLIITVLKPHNELNIQFYHYLLRSHYFSEEFYRNGKGLVSDLWTTKWEEMRNIYIPVPPREEQDQIVRYLDWQVSKINKLIHGYQKQIKLLEETKNTIVDNAVLHGMRKNNLIFSGNNLLGDIPEGWGIVKLRSLLTPISIKNHPTEKLLSVVRNEGVIIRDIENKEVNHNYIPDDLSGYKLVERGNFVINKMKAWQGSYGVSNYRGIVSPAYYVFDLKYECPEFFHIAIRSKRYVQFFSQASDGIRVGQWDLSMSRMKEIPFVVPPVEEQLEIVHYVKSQLAIIENTISGIQKQIDLLREYRTRLISDVVTGQIDVRDIVVPDYIPEEDTDIETDAETDTEEVAEDGN